VLAGAFFLRHMAQENRRKWTDMKDGLKNRSWKRSPRRRSVGCLLGVVTDHLAGAYMITPASIRVGCAESLTLCRKLQTTLVLFTHDRSPTPCRRSPPGHSAGDVSSVCGLVVSTVVDQQ
jgi:hypothetical protein